jgi:protocatechuate 3,4-dioxygenase beta subunit
MDFRGRVRTDADGRYRFRAIVPIAYPSPTEGPIADIRRKLGWHNMRPSHMHLKVSADGYQQLITQLFPKGDPWIESDGMFAVKASLVVVSTVSYVVEAANINLIHRTSRISMKPRSNDGATRMVEAGNS